MNVTSDISYGHPKLYWNTQWSVWGSGAAGIVCAGLALALGSVSLWQVRVPPHGS